MKPTCGKCSRPCAEAMCLGHDTLTAKRQAPKDRACPLVRRLTRIVNEVFYDVNERSGSGSCLIADLHAAGGVGANCVAHAVQLPPAPESGIATSVQTVTRRDPAKWFCFPLHVLAETVGTTAVQIQNLQAQARRARVKLQECLHLGGGEVGVARPGARRPAHKEHSAGHAAT